MKRIAVFVLFSYLPAWALCLWMALSPAALNLGVVLLAICMFFPALASLLTRLLTKEGFGGLRLRPHFKGNGRYYALAFFGPSVLIAAGAALWFLLNPSQFDPHLTALSMQVGAQAKTLVAAQLALGVLGGPLLNFIPALGEELGWRGYLLPKLCERLSPRAAVLASGVIWGVWHAPMIALGHNYGVGYAGYPWAGIAMMTLFCVAMGSFLAFLATRTDSVLPCALAHAGLNAMAAAGLLFTVGDSNPFIGPLPTGFVGGAFVLLLGGALLFTAPRWAKACAGDVSSL